METLIDKSVRFEGKLGLQQRVLPSYRAPFFDSLAARCADGLGVFAGLPREDEAIVTTDQLDIAEFTLGRNLHLFKGQFYLCFQPGLRGWLRKLDPEVLILEANPRNLSNRAAADWMHQKGRPVVGWGLGVPEADGSQSTVRVRTRVRYLSIFDALIAYSSIGAEQYAAAGIPEDRIYVAVNAVSPPPLRKPERGQLIDRAVRIIFVGRLQARKRVDLLIEACAAIEFPLELWIVGDGPEFENLERIASEIFPSTRFFGAKHGTDLSDLFDQADLFVLPGTGGLAVQEAMAHALPVIVADGDGTQRDLVKEGNGWLVEPGNYDELRWILNVALADPERLRRMGEEAYRIVCEEVNIDVMVDVFIRVVNELFQRVE
ncbi:MAG: glycosyltransferase [Anaerolineales bacterium]|nr:glycosyltransferase [Anaerolineales bacterium]